MKNRDNYSVGIFDGDLLDAVIANDATTVKALLSKHANPNCYEDRCKIRPLHFAAVYNSVDVIFPLIQAGASIEARTADGYTPLDLARQLNHEEITHLLLSISTNVVSFSE